MSDDERSDTEDFRQEFGKQFKTNTTTIHFLVRSSIGWIAWNERETALLRYFARTFKTLRCDLKFGEDPMDFLFEIEIPKEEMPKFEKKWRDKSLATDLDRIHGIHGAMGRKPDAKLVRMKTSDGTGLEVPKDRKFEASFPLEALQIRIQNLHAIQDRALTEFAAVKEQFNAQMNMISSRLNALTLKLDLTKTNFTDRMNTMQKTIMDIQAKELAC